MHLPKSARVFVKR